MKLKKIFYFLKSLVTKKKLNLIKDQEKIFSDNQLNYIEGQKKLKKVLQNIDLTKYNMASEHLKIFSSISLKDDTKNILEIGTYDGFNSLILNKLFPSALIDTLDLPESDNEFKNLYNRNIESKKKEFIQVRSNNINKTNKIKFFEKNSLDLIFENKKKYDSIFTVKKIYSWFWFENKPVNYNPRILPRSQDAKPIIQETTGIYGIRKKALKITKSRIGKNPYLLNVSDDEEIDLDNKKDFQYLKFILKK